MAAGGDLVEAPVHIVDPEFLAVERPRPEFKCDMCSKARHFISRNIIRSDQ